MSQAISKSSATEKRGREKQEGNFGLVLPEISADAMQKKGGRNEAEVIRDTYRCDSSKLSLSVMQKIEKPREIKRTREMSHSVLVPCGYSGTTPDELDGGRRDGAKPPSCSVSSSLPMWKKRRKEMNFRRARTPEKKSDRDAVGGFSWSGSGDLRAR